MSKHKVLINLSNIKTGGAKQVAKSFLLDLVKMGSSAPSYDLLLPDTFNEIKQKLHNSTLKVIPYNSNGFSLLSSLESMQKKYDLVFTLFGPKYTFMKAKIDIVGFAQSNIIYPEVQSEVQSNIKERLVSKLKYLIQKSFFQKADHIIVELDHVKIGVQEKLGFNPNSISVVKNTISNAFINPDLNALKIDECKKIKIGYITKDYPYKNIKILPKVAQILNKDFGMSVKFYLTLAPNEWKNHSLHFGKHGVSVGEINEEACPSFYHQMDAIIFPSLIESFSAVPLEAMYMNKAIFASDRNFVREICGENAIYFDPKNPYEISKKIYDYFKKPKNNISTRKYAMEFPSSMMRTKEYLGIINKHVSQLNKD